MNLADFKKELEFYKSLVEGNIEVEEISSDVIKDIGSLSVEIQSRKRKRRKKFVQPRRGYVYESKEFPGIAELFFVLDVSGNIVVTAAMSLEYMFATKRDILIKFDHPLSEYWIVQTDLVYNLELLQIKYFFDFVGNVSKDERKLVLDFIYKNRDVPAGRRGIGYGDEVRLEFKRIERARYDNLMKRITNKRVYFHIMNETVEETGIPEEKMFDIGEADTQQKDSNILFFPLEKSKNIQEKLQYLKAAKAKESNRIYLDCCIVRVMEKEVEIEIIEEVSSDMIDIYIDDVRLGRVHLKENIVIIRDFPMNLLPLLEKISIREVT